MTYYVEAYKSLKTINSGNDEKLSDRFDAYELDNAILYIEWYTYDNKVINQSPYKLLVNVKSKNNKLQSIFITEIKIISSLGKRYKVYEHDSMPVLVYSKKTSSDSISYKVFEPAFNFNFKQNEEIELQMTLDLIINGSRETKVIKDKYSPVRVKHYAPVV